MRLFVAVHLPDDVLEEAERCKAIIQQQSIKAKFVNREHMHITLLFLGDVQERDLGRIKQSLSTVKLSPFTATLDKPGVFSPHYVRVVWLGVQGAGFSKLYNDVCTALDKASGVDFFPHITLARVKALEDREGFLKTLRGITVNPVAFRVTGFELMSSVLSPAGPQYQTLAGYQNLFK